MSPRHRGQMSQRSQHKPPESLFEVVLEMSLSFSWSFMSQVSRNALWYCFLTFSHSINSDKVNHRSLPVCRLQCQLKTWAAAKNVTKNFRTTNNATTRKNVIKNNLHNCKEYQKRTWTTTEAVFDWIAWAPSAAPTLMVITQHWQLWWLWWDDDAAQDDYARLWF